MNYSFKFSSFFLKSFLLSLLTLGQTLAQQDEKDFIISPACAEKLINSSTLDNGLLLEKFLNVTEGSISIMKHCSQRFPSVSHLYQKALSMMKRSYVDCLNENDVKDILAKLGPASGVTKTSQIGAATRKSEIYSSDNISAVRLILPRIDSMPLAQNILYFLHEILHTGYLDNLELEKHNNSEVHYMKDRIFLLSLACMDDFMQENGLNNSDLEEFKIFDDIKSRMGSRLKCMRTLSMPPLSEFEIPRSDWEDFRTTRRNARKFCKKIHQ